MVRRSDEAVCVCVYTSLPCGEPVPHSSPALTFQPALGPDVSWGTAV